MQTKIVLHQSRDQERHQEDAHQSQQIGEIRQLSLTIEH